MFKNKLILRLRLRSTTVGRSLSGPNIRLRPKVKNSAKVQHCFFNKYSLRDSFDPIVKYTEIFDGSTSKEVCNVVVACSLLKLGSLKETFIASLFHSGLHSGSIFCGKNDVIWYFGERQVMPFFDKKIHIIFMMPN